MNEQDLSAAKISYYNIGINDVNDVIEFRAWCLVYAEELIAALEAAQQKLAEIKSFPGNYGLNKVNADLRAQLATLTIAVDAAKRFMEKAETERGEAQAEVERLDKANDELVLLLLRKHDPEGYKDFMKEYKYKEQGQWERQND